jgi:hypothetical protein
MRQKIIDLDPVGEDADLESIRSAVLTTFKTQVDAYRAIPEFAQTYGHLLTPLEEAYRTKRTEVVQRNRTFRKLGRKINSEIGKIGWPTLMGGLAGIISEIPSGDLSKMVEGGQRGAIYGAGYGVAFRTISYLAKDKAKFYGKKMLNFMKGSGNVIAGQTKATECIVKNTENGKNPELSAKLDIIRGVSEFGDRPDVDKAAKIFVVASPFIGGFVYWSASVVFNLFSPLNVNAGFAGSIGAGALTARSIGIRSDLKRENNKTSKILSGRGLEDLNSEKKQALTGALIDKWYGVNKPANPNANTNWG